MGISRERVGSIIHEDLGTAVSTPRSGSRNAWTRIKNVKGASRLSKFWIFFGAIQTISCRDWWPWTKPGYITMIRRQSNNQWSGGIAAHPAPKKFERKNPLEKFSPRFFRIKTASSSLIIFQRAKPSTQSITHLCWCNWRIFWRTNAAGGHQGGLALARQCPSSPGTCNQEETGLPGLPMSWIPTLFSGSGPVGLPPVPWTEKTIEGSPFFVRRGGHFAAAETWLDGQPSELFLSGLQKLKQKWIELRGENVDSQVWSL